MEKYFLFVDAANDVAMYPTHKLAAVTCAGDTTILIQFASGVAGGTGAGATEGDTMTLTIASGTEVAGYGRQHGDRVDFVKIDGNAATMIHEEHNPINVPPGVYRVTQVREFDHLSMTTRMVID